MNGFRRDVDVRWWVMYWCRHTLWSLDGQPVWAESDGIPLDRLWILAVLTGMGTVTDMC